MGELRALAWLPRQALGPRSRLSSPFGALCGTSAGVINAAALACKANRLDASVELVPRLWADFSACQVYRVDSLGVVHTGAHWLTMLSVGWIVARWRRVQPRSLFDNPPLAALLEWMPRMFGQHDLHTRVVTALCRWCWRVPAWLCW